jgi:hypothetical protein
MTEASFDGVTYLRCKNCGGFVVEGEAGAHWRGCAVSTGPPIPKETQAEMTLITTKELPGLAPSANSEESKKHTHPKTRHMLH